MDKKLVSFFRYRKSKWWRATGCIFLFLLVSWLSGLLLSLAAVRAEPLLKDNLEKFRTFDIEAEHMNRLGEWSGNKYHRLTTSFLFHGGHLKKDEPLCGPLSWYSLLMPERISTDYEDAFAKTLSELEYFPVGQDATGVEKVSYVDSWGGVRSYGGNRRHEGTDMMASKQERGYFPVFSVCQGTVEKKGWLNLGGYRLGIRGLGGVYFYYAHLDHYAEGIVEGKKVAAGELIGYMGDSGYGTEGTVGKFDVHLHFGIYLSLAGKEQSINPYQILRYLDLYKKHKPFYHTKKL